MILIFRSFSPKDLEIKKICTKNLLSLKVIKTVTKPLAVELDIISLWLFDFTHDQKKKKKKNTLN